ncbi:hypothetical protein BJP36_41940 [Moorena producens JHB]|uniref:Uncharacterized protein n=1 Tax=Moorena producens (strain JHB) TaxID=1454205 RepID=A0A9Q9SSP8_MOOP1|nr:hypothetical protein [Moorena producens]WAN68925.1 hypothetical protein BJP36_41940 [Moorena producens JHB]
MTYGQSQGDDFVRVDQEFDSSFPCSPGFLIGDSVSLRHRAILPRDET